MESKGSLMSRALRPVLLVALAFGLGLAARNFLWPEFSRGVPQRAEPDQPVNATIPVDSVAQNEDSGAEGITQDRVLLAGPPEVPGPNVLPPSPHPAVSALPGQPVDPSRWATIGSFPRIKTPDSEFDAKYAEIRTAAELSDLAYEKMQAWGLMSQQIGMARAASGQYETLKVPGDEVMIESGPDKGGAKIVVGEYLVPDLPKVEGYDELPRFTVGWASKEALMKGEFNVCWIPFDEYPDYYYLKDEFEYLFKKSGEAKKSGL